MFLITKYSYTATVSSWSAMNGMAIIWSIALTIVLEIYCCIF
jgi:hypothetical protein